MGFIFSKPTRPNSTPNVQGPSVSQQDKALLKLKIQRDKLSQQQVRLESVIKDLQNKAVDFVKQKMKERALLCLKQKKFQESLLAKADQNLMNIEQMVSQIEDSLIQAQIMQRLAEGNDLLREIEKEMSVEKVQMIMDESREHIERVEEINQILGTSLTDEDLSSIENEFNELIDEYVTTKILEIPQVPTTVPEIETQEIEEENVEETEEEEQQVVEKRKAVLA
ncbi:hypothetical protein RCL1_005974 [Eukaryota sp. TZLM3-RCL]